MECSLNTFKYIPLGTSRREIRLVLLSPASDFQSDIYCDLQYTSLDDEPSYEALSYAWGDASATSPIFLQNQLFLVTTNLTLALRHLRLEGCDRTLWIDAISINQTDLNERQQQVSLMGEIYKLAQWDLLWLGPELEPIDSVIPIFEYQFSSGSDDSLVEFKSLVQDMTVIPWGLFLDVFGSSVWERLWIVQELALAKEVHVIYGKKRLPWKSFCSIANIFLSKPYNDEVRTLGDKWWDGLVSASAIYDSWHLPSRRERNKRPKLLQVWQDFKTCKCIDRRDKIYAMLNIVEEGPEIQPDYMISISELFCLVARACIIRHRDLKVLEYAAFMEYSKWLCSLKTNGFIVTSLVTSGEGEELLLRNMLPSWVPDFGCTDSHSNSLWLQTPEGHDRWTKISWSSDSLHHVENYDIPTQISLAGLLIDTILDLSKDTTKSRQMTTSDSFEHYMQYYLERKTTQSEASSHLNGQSYDEAYWRTITCDLYHKDDYVLFRLHSEHMLDSWQKGLEALIEIYSRPMPENKRHQALLENIESARFYDHVIHMTWRYSFCTTSKGYMALVPESAKPGDIICCLYGGEVPYVLRPVSCHPDEDLMTLIGPAYLHGFMDGLPLKLRDDGVCKERIFVLT